jgi:hypothetical protein
LPIARAGATVRAMPGFVGNTNVLDIVGLKQELDGLPINDAICSVVIRTADGADVVGPLPMNHLAGSSGDYRAFIAADVALTAKAAYVALIDVDGGPGRVGHFEFQFKAQKRVDA